MKIEALVILGVGAAALYRVWIWLKDAPYTPDPWGAEVGGALEDPKSAPVCPHCLIPQEHNGWFCPECGSTVGQFSNYLPAVYIVVAEKHFGGALALGLVRLSGCECWRGD
jgi:hypothetical protein